jgi:coenzyme F420-reducing hydrogenase delta subunit
VLPVDCAGSVHSSVVEAIVRSGAGGVLVMACPVEDCWNREGAQWLEQRLFHGREAELQERVDRRRVAIVNLARSESTAAREAVDGFRSKVAELRIHDVDEDFDLLRLCESAGADEDDAGAIA